MSDELTTIPRATLAELKAKADAFDEMQKQEAQTGGLPPLAERFAKFQAREVIWRDR